MHYTHKNSGTCSKEVSFDIIDGKLYNVEFLGGCNGNAKGISKLVEGADAEDVMNRVIGVTCGWKSTSCPDQLALAIREALNK